MHESARSRWRLLLYWWAELFYPTVGAAAYSIAMSCVIALLRGQVPPPRVTLAYFVALWAGMLLLLARRLPAKQRAYRRFQSCPPEERTLEKAMSLFAAEYAKPRRRS